MDELTKPVHTVFTEVKLRTRPSMLYPKRPLEVTLCYNTEFWEVEVSKGDYILVSPYDAFGLSRLRSEQYHVINFDSSRYPARYPSGHIPVKTKFIDWCRGGKYDRTLALFYSLRFDSGDIANKVIAVAAYDLEAYHRIKHAMVETYLDWAMTGKLPVFSLEDF